MVLKVFKSFRPSGSTTLVIFVLVCIFATLGMWQLKRAAEKNALEQQNQVAKTMALNTAIEQNSRFARIHVRGHFDPVRHILLDNQIWQGRAGVFVFTPFYSLSGNAILVNRGWVPLDAGRKVMPVIPTSEQEIVLKGILNIIPVPGMTLGTADSLQQDQWPQLVTYLNLPDISESLKTPLESWVVQLSKEEPGGFDGREWKPVFLSSDRHKGYAFQWFALLAASIIMWLYLGFRKTSGNNK